MVKCASTRPKNKYPKPSLNVAPQKLSKDEADGALFLDQGNPARAARQASS
jgi:hypothetical protein